MNGLRLDFGSSNYSSVVSVAAPMLENAVSTTGTSTVTVPNGEMWKVVSAYYSVVASATVGSRQWALQLRNSAGAVLFSNVSAATQTAGLTRVYQAVQGGSRDSAFAPNQINIALPIDAYLSSGMTIVFFDTASISASDAITGNVYVQRFKGC